MWNLVPQVFYDLVARVMPGGVLIVASTLVITGPSDAIGLITKPNDNTELFSIGAFLIGILLAYAIGIIVGQLWEITIGRTIRKTLAQEERSCKDTCLAEHNLLLKQVGRPEVNLEASNLPRVSTMREHLRIVAPQDAARLLKVRGEYRSCEVLCIGFLTLLAINSLVLRYDPSIERMTLEALLAIAVPICWTKVFGLRRHFVNGATIFWLTYFSNGQIPSK